jgi:hypothetical protein
MAKRATLILSLAIDGLPLHSRYAILLGGAPGEQWHVDLLGIAVGVLELLEGNQLIGLNHLIDLEDEHGRRLAGDVRLKPGASECFAHLEGCGPLRPAGALPAVGIA